MVKDFKVFLR
jgi:hypothetical protein